MNKTNSESGWVLKNKFYFQGSPGPSGPSGEPGTKGEAVSLFISYNC